MMIKTIERLYFALVAMVLMLVMAGCGGIGSGDTVTAAGGTITLSGTVLTPGGSAAFRSEGRAAAAFASVTVSVPVSIYVLSATGRTFVASGATNASGDFTIALPSGINLSDYVVLAEATVGAGAIRSFVSTSTTIAVSPASEALVQVVEEQLAAAGRSVEALSIEEIRSIQNKSTDTVSVLDFSTATSVSEAVTIAKNAVTRDADVIAAIATAISTTPAVRYAIFTTTDYSTGQVTAIQLNGSPELGSTVRTNLATVNADAILISDDRYVYVINRGADNIQVIDPRDNFATIANYSTGNGSNPHDMEIISAEKAYITLYQKNYVLIVNPLTGRELGRIDLSAFADSDGIPDIDQMVFAGGKLFITLQRLVSYSPSAGGLIVVVDTATDTVVDTDASTSGTQAIALNGYNPQAIEYVSSANKLYISCAGSYFSDTVPGGIDEVDLTTYAVNTVLSKAELGGTPGDLKIASTTKGYVVVSGADWSNKIWAFNPAASSLTGDSALYTSFGYVPYIGIDPYGYLLISDTDYMSPGVSYIDISSGEIVPGGSVNTGLPPFAMTFIEVPEN